MRKLYKACALLSAFAIGGGSLGLFSDVKGSADVLPPAYTDGNEMFETEFFLGAWCEPELSDTEFEKYMDYGFNVMYFNNEVQYNTRRFLEYLKKCDEYGLKAIVASGGNRVTPTSLKYQKTSLAEYPAFYGICAIDEPLGDGSPREEDEIQATERTNWESHNTVYDYIYSEYEYLSETYPGKFFGAVINYGPDEGDFGYGSLDAYVTYVLSKIPQQDWLLEFDKYPYRVLRNGSFSLNDAYLWTLYRAEETSKELSVSRRIYYYQQWWPFAMREYLSAQEITYQLYSAMCFGVNGFTAYKYASYWADYNDFENFTMNSAWGETELNYYNQVALNEIKNFDYIYLNFADDWQGVMKVPGSEYTDGAMGNFSYLTGEYVLDSYAGISAVTATQDTIIGVMKDKEGRDGYMLSNQSFTLDRRTDTVSVTFANATHALVVEKGEIRTAELTDGTYTVELEPGSGAFVIPY